MAKKSLILDCFTKAYLNDIAKDYGIAGASGINKSELILMLAKRPNVKTEEILNELSLENLKIICQGVGVDDIGRKKTLLIDRLLGRDKKEKPKTTQTSKTQSKTKKKKKATMTKKQTKGFKGSTTASNETNNNELEKKLWDAADQLRANSALTAQEYSRPVLGLIFLKYADHRFTEAEKVIAKETTGGRRIIGKLDYQEKGVMYLPDEARFSKLLKKPEGSNIGKALNDAMELIESENEDLKGILPRTYNRLENPLLFELLKLLNSIPMDIKGDVFGRIYEYFLGKFAMSEGRGGGEFFTPTSIVKLIVNIIEPYHGRIYDPACGSGGMFVQSAKFVTEHQKSASKEISVFGQESKNANINIGKMNLAVHGLSGDIRLGNTYYEDFHNSLGRFDFVMANPPFNVNGVDKERIKDDPRYKLGLPRTDNANYIWIQDFYSALNANGRAGFVMANSASDARQSELEIRKKLIESGDVDVMVTVSPNFFYTVTLPVTLWFFDRHKSEGHKDKVLFIDARNIYNQIDRAHRDFSPSQLEFLSNIVRLYRGEEVETRQGSEELLNEHFPEGKYHDVKGLCNIATLDEIKAQGWSLNPGRYVGVAELDDDGVDFYLRLEELNEELEILNSEAWELEERIARNIDSIMELNI
jgi:type I restriction enzyme M protein